MHGFVPSSACCSAEVEGLALTGLDVGVKVGKAAEYTYLLLWDSVSQQGRCLLCAGMGTCFILYFV